MHQEAGYICGACVAKAGPVLCTELNRAKPCVLVEGDGGGGGAAVGTDE
jgi:hypothetical protein